MEEFSHKNFKKPVNNLLSCAMKLYEYDIISIKDYQVFKEKIINLE